jgi:acetyl esterase/lipase
MPIFMPPGGAHDRYLVVEAEQVVDSLKQRNIPVEYVLFPDEGHGFSKTPNRIRSEVSIVRWFTQHLYGREWSGGAVGALAPPCVPREQR